MTQKRDVAALAAAADVARRGGIVRSAALVREGIGKWAIADAVAAGLLVRLRRVWVAVPQADAMLVAAARHGVVLTCVTQARRLGLWTLADEAVHVGIHPHAGSVPTGDLVVHRNRSLVPRTPGALVDPLENVLLMVALCQPRERALAIWESALRKRLVDKQSLRRLALPAGVRALCEEASEISDSGLETLVRVRLAWLDVSILAQIWIHGHRVDFLIGERLVLQIDGGTHVGVQRSSDNAHDAALMLRGYHVLRVGYHDVIERWPVVQDLIVRAIAQRLHVA